MIIKSEYIIIPILLILILFSVSYKTISSDTYLHYTVAREIIKDPSFLLTGDNYRLTSLVHVDGDRPWAYPPMIDIFYAIFFFIGIPATVITAIIILLVFFMAYKIDELLIFVMFLSFMLVREMVYGGTDILLMLITMGSFYFFNSRPKISGALAGLATLTKGLGFFVLFGWLLAFIIFKRKEWKKYLFAFIIALLVLAPWYTRNLILFNGDIFATIVNQPLASMQLTEEAISAQEYQPEREFIDTTGFSQTYVDILLVTGIFFLVINFMRNRRFELEHAFILPFIIVFIIAQLTGFTYLMAWRYQLPIFPFLALAILKGVGKYKKYVIIASLALLIFYISIIPEYSMGLTISKEICDEAKEFIGNGTVYVDLYHNWFYIYQCDFPYDTKENADYILDEEQLRSNI